MMIIKYYCLKEIDDTAFKKQMHSGWWGLSRKTISLLYLRHKNFSCGIFFCFMSPPFNTTMLCNFKSFLPTERGLNLRIFTPWKPRCQLVWIPSWFYFLPYISFTVQSKIQYGDKLCFEFLSLFDRSFLFIKNAAKKINDITGRKTTGV